MQFSTLTLTTQSTHIIIVTLASNKVLIVFVVFIIWPSLCKEFCQLWRNRDSVRCRCLARLDRF